MSLSAPKITFWLAGEELAASSPHVLTKIVVPDGTSVRVISEEHEFRTGEATIPWDAIGAVAVVIHVVLAYLDHKAAAKQTAIVALSECDLRTLAAVKQLHESGKPQLIEISQSKNNEKLCVSLSISKPNTYLLAVERRY